MNIWNYALGADTIKDLASCSSNLRGNVISSDVTEFDTPGVEVEVVPMETFCTDDTAFFIVPMKRYLSEALVFCNLVDTTVYIPPNEKMNIKLYEESNLFKGTCDGRSYKRLLLGASDEETEGVWLNINTGEPIVYDGWAPGEPNSGAGDACAIMRNDMPFWGDITCDGLFCFPCGRTIHDYVFVRGLCQPVEHQIRFIMDGYVNDRPYFRGYYGMAMYYVGHNEWVFKDTNANLTIATTHLHNPEDYPVGRSTWDVVNTFCSYAPEEKMELGLSTCTTEHYMCSDGSCVDRDVRCNLREDCADGSDENHCGIVEFTGRYARHRPPPGETFQDQLLIFPHVHLVRFSDIDDINLAFYMEFEVLLAWTDRNLKFKNVKAEEAKNQLSSEEVESIWSPEVEFLNVNDGILKEIKSGVYARRSGPAEPPLFNDAKMDTIYQPQSVSLVRKTFYSGSFTCNFLLYNYPFDSQTCSALIKLDSADTSVINFSNATVEYSGFADLPKFTVENITIELGEAFSYAVMEVKFKLDRRWSLLVLTIFLPTNLLVGIGYITLFIQLRAFQERIIMTLTTLLVMYTMFEQVSNNLPATAYIKMVDMWFCFCIFLIFSLIIVHVVIEYLPVDAECAIDRKDEGASAFRMTWLNGTSIIKATRLFVYPGIFLMFNFGFWVSIVSQ